MSDTDAHAPAQPPSPRSTAHAYASNGLEILQAATDAAEAIQNSQAQALQNAAAQAVGHAAAQLPHPDHDASHLMSPHGDHSANGGAGLRDPTINPKLTRLRRACDMCSMRKVKCDDSNIPCRPCRELGVDCTYNRETKRRGPPNKHAEAAKAAKRARMDIDAAAGFVSPTAAPSAGPSVTNSPSTQQQLARTAIHGLTTDLDAESIAPMGVLELLIDDFFTYIHPLAPFPHEPSFRQAFANREDRTRPEFLGLIASMIATLVASFPRCAREHLKAQHNTHLFPKAIVLIEKCRDIALHTRGHLWVLKEPKTMDDAATSYFLALASVYTLKINAGRHFFSETLSLMRELGFVRPEHQGSLPNFGVAPGSDPSSFDHIRDQIGKRIFYCLLLGVRSMFQVDNSHSDIVIAPSTPNLPYPAYPENVDDSCIMANEIIHQPEGTVTLITGFRFGIDIYTTINGVVSLELAYGMNTLPWADQRILLRDGLVAAKSIIDDLPPELQLGTSTADNNPLSALDESGVHYAPPAWPSTQPANDLRNIIKSQPQRRRELQYEIQKANIFVSQLATRSYFVELYFDLRDVYLGEQAERRGAAAPTAEEKALLDADDKEIHEFMSAERELIVQNLLTVLGSISQRNLEPNGGSVVVKIRQVASTLLHDSPQRKGPVAVRSEDALSQLIQVLIRLEKTTSSRGRSSRSSDSQNMTSADEEDELRTWADLREYQLRLASAPALPGMGMS